MDWIHDPGNDMPYTTARGVRSRAPDEWDTDDPIGQLLALIEGPDWMKRAACKGKGDLFFPGRGEHLKQRAAMAICKTCPVKNRCLEWALNFSNLSGRTVLSGVWAGTSERGREKIIRARREKAA